MPPGVASVMVQVLTGDADAKLKHLGDTAIGQAQRMEAAWGKAGETMGASMGDAASAIDVAIASSDKYNAALTRLANAEKALATATANSAREVEAANAKVAASLDDVKAAQERVARSVSPTNMMLKKRADEAYAAAQVELDAAKKSAAAKQARFAGGVEAAGAGVAAAKVTATREAEAQLALSAKNAEAYAKQQAAIGRFAAFGGKALAGLAAASVVVGVEAVKMGKGFEDAQRKFEGATGAGVGSRTKPGSAAFGAATERRGRALSAEFERSTGKQQSGQELEGSYANVAKQVEMTQKRALSAGEAYKFMTAASNLQAASGEKLGNVTKDLASVMQVYKVKLGEAADTSNKMFNASRLVSTSVDSMTSLVTKLHARLGDIGGGLNNVLGLMSEAASFGLTGGRGVLIFNQALERMTSSSKPVTETLEHLNVHLHNSKNEFVGMPSVIEQLHGAYQKLTPAQREFATQQLFGKGATGEFTEIIRNGKGGLEEFTKAALKHGEVERAATKSNETFTGQLKIMWANIQTAGGALGHSLIPELKDVAGALGHAAEWLGKNNGAALALAGVITTVLGAAMGAFVAGKVAGMISGLQAMGGAMLSLVGAARTTEAGVDAALVGTGIGATVVALGFTVLALKDHWKEAMKGLEEAAQGAANFVIDRLNEMIRGVNAFIQVVTAGLGPTIGEIGRLSGAGQESARDKRINEGGSKVEEAVGQAHQHVLDAGGGAMGFFEAKGFSPAQAAGIVGNWQQESSLNFGLNEKDPEGGTNIGIASWHDPTRQAELKSFAKTRRKPWTDPHVQLEFTLKELGPGGVAKLKSVQSSARAAEIFNEIFEKGTDPEGVREKYAEKAIRDHPPTQRMLEQAGEGNAALQQQKEEREHGKPKESEAQKEAKAKAKERQREEREGTINPFAHAHGLTQTREDMGLDYSMKVGDKIVAPGAGVIDKIIQNWYTDPRTGKSQPLIEEKITAGKDKGMYFYVAEQINAAVRQGQRVKAGQTLGTFAASGTGVEAGLGAGGGLTLAQSRHEFHDHPGNDPTRASDEFKKFLSGLGHGGGGGLEQSGANSAFEKATKIFEALTKAGTTLFKKYEDNLQSGTVRSLEKLTGASAQDPTGRHSVQYAQLQTDVGNLRASGQTDLANKLVIVHKEAMRLLREAITAQGRERLAQELSVEITHLKDLENLRQKTFEAELSITKDKATQTDDASKAASQAMVDAATEFRARTDMATTEMADAAKTMSDEFSGAAQRAKDSSDIKVKELEERGKYGLNLQAQREEVQLAILKQGYDQQVNQAKISLDQLRAQEDHLVKADQLNLIQVTTRENALVAAAQATLDAEKIYQEAKLQVAGEAVTRAQMRTDAQVGHDLTAAVAEALNGEKAAAQKILQAKVKDDEEKGKGYVQFAEEAMGEVRRKGERKITEAESALNKAKLTAEEQIAIARTAVENAEAGAQQMLQEAQTRLERIEGEAAVKEAEAEGRIAVTGAEAQTQYAGSGLIVNFTNIPMDDTQALIGELGFIMRTQLPLPS